MKPQPWELRSPHTAAFSAVGGDDCLFEKEIAYEALFTKRNSLGDTDFQLKVNEDLIDHWVRTFDRMKRANIPVPVPLEHNTAPDKRVGTVVSLEKRYLPERDGRASLFAKIRFHSPEDAQKYANSDVSLFMPPRFYSGLNEEFVRPVRHVCITDYPVIPGLKGFEKAAALSFSLAEEETMSIVELANQLGIPLPEGATDEDAAAAIQEQFAALQQPGDEEEPLEEESLEEEDPMMEEEEAPMGFSAAPVLPTVVNSVASARALQLKDLVRTGRIQPAVAKRFEAMYCSTKAVEVSLSLESMGHAPDDFEGVMAALSLASPVGQAPAGGAAPVHKKTGQSSLVANAAARAEAAKRMK